ncbi:MAG: type II toxin-antitoxin system PemK/MazF family toxin [Thermodesulfobacteriota bacterium]
MEVNRFDVFLVNLDPTAGHEIKKTRPCLVISPDEMNRCIGTVIVAPMTTEGRAYPNGGQGAVGSPVGIRRPQYPNENPVGAAGNICP